MTALGSVVAPGGLPLVRFAWIGADMPGLAVLRLEVPGQPEVTMQASREAVGAFLLEVEGASALGATIAARWFIFDRLVGRPGVSDAVALATALAAQLASDLVLLARRALAGQVGARGATAYRRRAYPTCGWGLGSGHAWRAGESSA